MAIVRTLAGDISPDELGTTLIHEHLVVDVRLPAERPAPYHDDVDAIVSPMIDHLRQVRGQGVSTIVECTPTIVGQHLPAYRLVGECTGLRIVAAVGTYRDAWLPSWVRNRSVDDSADWFVQGIRDGAGFVKIGCDPNGPTPAEARCATAAGRASAYTGALVACHVGHAAAAHAVIDAFVAGGGDPTRFVVVHLQNEPDAAAHLALARRGAWVEYDAIGAHPADAVYVGWLRALADADLLDRVLVSQDACAYMILADGRVERQHRFDYLLGRFVPALRAAGFTAAEVDRLVVGNPAQALAMAG